MKNICVGCEKEKIDNYFTKLGKNCENKTYLKSQLQKVAAEINVIEIKRNSGVYVPLIDLRNKQKEFKNLSYRYKKYLKIQYKI